MNCMIVPKSTGLSVQISEQKLIAIFILGKLKQSFICKIQRQTTFLLKSRKISKEKQNLLQI